MVKVEIDTMEMVALKKKKKSLNFKRKKRGGKSVQAEVAGRRRTRG